MPNSVNLHTVAIHHLPQMMSQAQFMNYITSSDLACSESWEWPTAVKYSLNVHHMENVLGPTLTEGKVLLSLAVEDKHSKGEYRGWIIPTLLDNTDVSNVPTRSLQHSINFEMIREWLDFCDCNHSDGCGMAGHDSIPFFRLIDCTTRLIVDAPPESKFAALSYRWAPGESFTQDRLKQLPELVPLVIEDALDVAARLDIPYLWVDRYCNEQHKASPIKPIQLQNMHKVYRSAYVTIITGCGDHPEFGLPGISSRARKPQISVDTHGHRLVCIPDVVQEIQDCTWSTRGWTLQENLLSRRRLVFTETQTYFQCWHMHCCETIPTCLTRAHTKDLTRFKENHRTFRVFPQKGIGKTGAEIEMRIQEYLGRQLSNESDALNAFLGIFQAFQELDRPISNFWGFPMSRFGWAEGGMQQSSSTSEHDELRASFLSSLAWSNDPCNHTNAHILAPRQNFPSWTWAAWQSLRTFSRKFITVVSHGWKHVHALILQSLPDGTHMRLGVVTWSLLGRPSVDERHGVLRVKEVFEARRVVPRCQCGCQMSTDSSFDRYLEDDSHVMEFKKADIVLV